MFIFYVQLLLEHPVSNAASNLSSSLGSEWRRNMTYSHKTRPHLTLHKTGLHQTTHYTRLDYTWHYARLDYTWTHTQNETKTLLKMSTAKSCQTLVLQTQIDSRSRHFACAYWENIRTRCCYATLGARWAHVCEDDAMTQLFQKTILRHYQLPTPSWN